MIATPTGGIVTDVRVVPGTGSANAANSSASIVNGKAVLTVPAVDGGLTGTTFTPTAARGHDPRDRDTDERR